MWGTGQGEWLERLERENYNLRAAITQALEADEGETAARLCWALWLFWWVRGHHREGRRLAEAALEHDLPASLRAKASLAAATMSYTLADYPAAGAYWEQALRSSQQANELLTQAYSWAGTGLVELVRPDYAEAASRMERALELFEASEDDSIASLTRTWLGTTLMARGELEGAEKNFMQGLESARRRQDPLCTYLALYNLSQLALTREDLPSAARSLREGIELSGETGDRANLAHFLEALAVVCSLRDEAERAAVLLGSAEGSLQKVGAPGYNYYVPDPVLRECAVIGAKTALGEDSFERARKRGKDLSFGQTVEYALEIATPDEPTSG